MKNLIKILPFFLCVLILVFTPFTYKKTAQKKKFPISVPTQKFVLTLWNIDVFEGGKGSRSDFLSSVSLSFKNDGVLIMVVSHSIESAKIALNNGTKPDMISFGVGVDFVSNYAKSLPKISFLGGEIGGQIYAYPWCAGGYFLIRKNQNNQPIDDLFISQNSYNMPFGAIYKANLEAKKLIYKEPLDAYTLYLSGDRNDALLGTQRDLVRLTKRGVEYYAEPLYGFCDLVQYVSVLTGDKDRYKICVEFCEFLISRQIQEKLSDIKMASVFFKSQSEGHLDNIDFEKIEYTISPFTDALAIKSIISQLQEEKITNNSLLQFKNMLKRL